MCYECDDITPARFDHFETETIYTSGCDIHIYNLVEVDPLP